MPRANHHGEEAHHQHDKGTGLRQAGRLSWENGRGGARHVCFLREGLRVYVMFYPA